MGFLDKLFDGADNVLDQMGVPRDGMQTSVVVKEIQEDTKKWVEVEIDLMIGMVAALYPDLNKKPTVKEMIEKRLRKFAEDAFSRGVSSASRLAVLSDD